MVEAVAGLRLPPRADQRLQVLMDRNTEGALRFEGREELEDLVELSETIALVRAQRSTCWDVNPHDLVGQTPAGRATVLVLDLNHPRRILIRQAEALYWIIPPLERPFRG